MSKRVTRRKFLSAYLPACGGSLLMHYGARAFASALSAKKFDVIIIGAGIAGLAAARRLQLQAASVLVLEGRNRIGGRVWTDAATLGVPLDLGAAWIQGTNGNPIAALARKEQLRMSPTVFENIALYDSAGRRLSNSEVERIEKNFQSLSRQIERLRNEMQRQGQTDISLRAGIDRILSRQSLTDQQRVELNYAISTVIEDEYAADAADLSLFNWDQDDGFGGPNVLFPGGFGQIATGLARGLDIRLNTTVTRIEYDSQAVKVQTNQNTFIAARALVTLPLGVLKAGAVTFSPALPAEKLRAIRNLGMGVLDKVYLRFPKVFWPGENDMLGVLSTSGEWGEWINYYKVSGQPVLLAFNRGKYARYLEGLADGQVLAAAMKVLRDVYGSSIPDPNRVLITRWGADPFTHGSYSSISPQASGKDYDLMAAPVGDRVFFAGEATSRKYPATVHGAFLSGEREAKRISSL